jgi:3-hydroxyisobutyrate dehydrogenase
LLLRTVKVCRFDAENIMKIAFIGLGNMGAGMAAVLVSVGHEVVAFDVSPDAQTQAIVGGCIGASSVRDAVAGCDSVVTMLPNGEIVKSVYFSDIIGAAPAGACLIDCSTIEVATARLIGQSASNADYHFVDAPVSGGIAAARSGQLTFMVGGDLGAFNAAQPILSAMGKAVIHAGESGSGQAAKICNNMLLGASMVATCETFVMAQKLGLDPQTFFDIASKASGQCWSMTSYCPLPGVGPKSPADDAYQGGFAAALMLKDLNLAMDAANSVQAAVPMGEKAAKLYADWVAQGHGSSDFSSIIKTL